MWQSEKEKNASFAKGTNSINDVSCNRRIRGCARKDEGVRRAGARTVVMLRFCLVTHCAYMIDNVSSHVRMYV